MVNVRTGIGDMNGFKNIALKLGNGTGYPGVFPANPCPYPSQPVPVPKGLGFGSCGSWVEYNPRVPNPYKGLH
jgi:hypothetical protein